MFLGTLLQNRLGCCGLGRYSTEGLIAEQQEEQNNQHVAFKLQFICFLLHLKAGSFHFNCASSN